MQTDIRNPRWRIKNRKYLYLSLYTTYSCTIRSAIYHVFAPLIARLAALSFRDGIFPSRFKVASVTPLLKKQGLDGGEPANYRPISNLNNISKILERLFLRNIIGHVGSSPNFNRYQSAYRRGHSTETALLRLLNDLCRAADTKSRSILILLDLSAAFDTIDSGTLLRRLEFSFGIHGRAHGLDRVVPGREVPVREGR